MSRVWTSAGKTRKGKSWNSKTGSGFPALKVDARFGMDVHKGFAPRAGLLFTPSAEPFHGEKAPGAFPMQMPLSAPHSLFCLGERPRGRSRRPRKAVFAGRQGANRRRSCIGCRKITLGLARTPKSGFAAGGSMRADLLRTMKCFGAPAVRRTPGSAAEPPERAETTFSAERSPRLKRGFRRDGRSDVLHNRRLCP